MSARRRGHGTVPIPAMQRYGSCATPKEHPRAELKHVWLEVRVYENGRRWSPTLTPHSRRMPSLMPTALDMVPTSRGCLKPLAATRRALLKVTISWLIGRDVVASLYWWPMRSLSSTSVYKSQNNAPTRTFTKPITHITKFIYNTQLIFPSDTYYFITMRNRAYQPEMMRIAIAGGGGFSYILAQELTQSANAVLVISRQVGSLIYACDR